MTDLSPARIAGIWATLEGLAGRIADEETRAQTLTAWRARYDEAFPRWLDDGSILHLPDWEHVSEISALERRQAAKVSAAWLDGLAVDRGDATVAKRLCWELGRREAAGLIAKGEAAEASLALLGSTATSRGAMAALARGLADRGAGEGLLAAIVLDLRCARFDRNEDGLAERFRARHGHNFRHTTGKGWLQWDGRRWRVLDEEKGALPAELMGAAADTVRAIQREAAAIRATGLAATSIPEGADSDLKVEMAAGKVKLGDLDTCADGADGLVMTAATCRLASVALGRWGLGSGELKRYRALVDIARRWLTVRVQDFDRDPLTINCQNGTLRLVRHVDRDEYGDRVVRCEAVLGPHRRDDLLTRVAAVPYDPDAACPLYDGVIEWAQEKPAIRRYLHQWGGYCLTGDMGAQIFHMWWGPGAQNGKSTILDAWAGAAGDYAEGGKIEIFMEAASAKAGDAATPALARLPGVRMLRTGEPPANARLDESLINQITGQDPLLIRDNFRSFFEIKLQFKLTVACNVQPTIPNGTEGIKRRVKVVIFSKSLNDEPDRRDPDMPAKLVPEYPGIFARLIEGALDWLRGGFAEPDEVRVATDDFKDDNDPLGRFLAYCTVRDGASRIQSSRLHELFVAWGKATGGPDWTQTFFTKKMKAKGFSTKQSNGMQWLGLRMVREVGDFITPEGKVRDLAGIDDGGGDSGGSGVEEGRVAAWIDPAADWLPGDDPFGA